MAVCPRFDKLNFTLTFDQSEFDLRCEWSFEGLAQLAPISAAVIVVDILSFSTAVDIAVSKGAVILPFDNNRDAAGEYARAHGARLATPVRAPSAGFSLSPQSLARIPPGYRLVLPSRNGAALCLRAPAATLVGCLRNRTAVAEAAARRGAAIAVIPAGERWPDGSLRPCFEDWIGAGAILSRLPGRPSPEAEAAIAAFERSQRALESFLCACSSGKELLERGLRADVELAAALDASPTAPEADFPYSPQSCIIERGDARLTRPEPLG